MNIRSTAAAVVAAALLAPVTAAAPSRYQELVAKMKARQSAEAVLELVDTQPASGAPPAVAGADDGVIDRLTFRNGDRVSGLLESIRSGVVRFAGFQSQAIEADQAALADLESRGTYEVTLTDGSVLVASFRPTGRPDTLGLSTLTGTEEVPGADVVGVETVAYAEARRLELARAGKVTLGKVWKGHLDAKYSDSSGNTEVRNMVVAAEATRTTEVDKLRVGLLTTNASANNTKTAQRSWGDVRMDLYLPRDLFYFFQGRLESDELEQVDLRTTLGLGIGKRFRGGHNLVGAFGLGYSFVREAFNNNTDNSEGTLLVTVDVDRDLTDTVSLEHRMIAYPKVSSGEFRFQTTTNFKSSLGKNLSFLVGFFNKYDSDPLAGLKKNDFTLTTGIRREF